MFSYIIRRILLMIPTFIGITVIYFFILSIVPGGPLEQEIMKLKAQQMQGGEGGSSGGSTMGGEIEISPEAMEKMKKFYGFDKPIWKQYLLWLGLWERDINEKELKFGEAFRFNVEYIKDGNDLYELQKWIKLVKTDTDEIEVYESGIGADFAFQDYPELPLAEDIENWYKVTDWDTKEVKKAVKLNKISSIDNEMLTSLKQNGYSTADKVADTDFGKLLKVPGIDNQKAENLIALCEDALEDEALAVYKQDTLRVFQTTFSGIIHGDLGESHTYREPVSSVIVSRLYISAYFGILGMILTYLVSIPLGILKAIHHNSKFDAISSILVFVGYAIPGFALGILLLMFFGGGSFWDLFPLGDFRSPNFDELSFLEQIWDQIHHTILPIISWFIGSFATLTILMKNSLLENLSQDYVRTAFAKGLSEKRVIFLHAVRNSLIPLASQIGLIIGVIFAGSYLIEKTFNIDGIGLLSFNSLLNRDYPIALGFLVISSVIRLIGNLISDITYAAIDPRIRFK